MLVGIRLEPQLCFNSREEPQSSFRTAIDGPVPDPEFFARETNWAWVLLAPQPNPNANDAATTEALRKLYGDPRVTTR
jgi:hypothetical protein